MEDWQPAVQPLSDPLSPPRIVSFAPDQLACATRSYCCTRLPLFRDRVVIVKAWCR